MNDPRVLILHRDALDLSAFTAGELAQAERFTLEKRREEWLLSRLAAKQLAVRLGIVADPLVCTIERPYLLAGGEVSHWYVSLSHSAPYAAAAIDQQPIGIDIEMVRPMNDATARLFLSDDEAAAVRRCPVPDAMLHAWCAKEAAWKQRSGEFATMKRLPLRLLESRDDGLQFDAVTTWRDGNLLVAVTTPR
jgi:phosphopantetheinyl transferase